jgi:xylulokinase
MYLLGYDVGSSSIKATVLDGSTGKAVASAISPADEMEILASKPGWAEQHPDVWWKNVVAATQEILRSGVDLKQVSAVGISYQMHGLVTVDKNGEVLRPSIIWCDSRAVSIGDRAFTEIGPERCLTSCLNSPGNFTASKLRWVKENEPELYEKIDRFMLPGDYIALKMTGEAVTTPSGLSEGILWDFQTGDIARMITDHYGISKQLVPPVVPTFSIQGKITKSASTELGLEQGVPVSYRGGDQPNNALSLNVLNPGEMAATAGTSGVVYGVGATPSFDPDSRFNTFVHVNHSKANPRYGNLLCLNGTGILYSWLRHNFMSAGGESLSYREMDELAGGVPMGSEGLIVLPFGNGAERTLRNRNLAASMHGLEFNIHTKAHALRAAHEGIVFALGYGVSIMEDCGVPVRTVRAGNTNMFKSSLFAGLFATVTGARVELYDTDGSQGAARGAAIGAGIYGYEDAFVGLESTSVVEPNREQEAACREAYEGWVSVLENRLAGEPSQG